MIFGINNKSHQFFLCFNPAIRLRIISLVCSEMFDKSCHGGSILFFLEIAIFFKAMPKNWSKGKSKLRILWTAKVELSILWLQRKKTIQQSGRIQNSDTMWTLLKALCIQSRMEVPTWAAYNSVIGKSNPLTLVSTFSIINGSPTEWDNLYTAIRMAND